MMAKVQLEKLFGKSLEGSLRVCFAGTEGSEMARLAPF
jgi:hypothetical protein